MAWAGRGTPRAKQAPRVVQSVIRAWPAREPPPPRTGLVIVGGPGAYQLVLYEPSSKRPFSITPVAPELALHAHDAQYVSFDDEQANSWSVFFPSAEQLRIFLQHATLVRAAAAAADAAPVVQVRPPRCAEMRRGEPRSHGMTLAGRGVANGWRGGWGGRVDGRTDELLAPAGRATAMLGLAARRTGAVR